MSENHTSEIIYEEGWRDASPAVQPPADEPPIDEAPAAEPAAPSSRPLLISIQLILCLLFLLVMFLLKSMDSDVYHRFMDFYKAELSRPVIAQGVFDAMDVSRLMRDAPVEVTKDDDALLYR